jgi:hypothetical protein
MALCSCLSVNKTGSEILLQFYGRIHGNISYGEKMLLNVIILHLSDETKNNLRDQGFLFSTTYQRPLLNYISFVDI